MKKSLSCALLVLTLLSCKKDKDEFTPATVVYAECLLTYKEEDGKHNSNCYTLKGMDGVSINALNQDISYQETAIFGYYKQNEGYGLYSLDDFPKAFGQENWPMRLSTRFRKSTLTAEQIEQLRAQYPDGFPVHLILDQWKKGSNEQSHINQPKKGETYAFRCTDGKISGLFHIQDITHANTRFLFELWAAR